MVKAPYQERFANIVEPALVNIQGTLERLKKVQTAKQRDLAN